MVGGPCYQISACCRRRHARSRRLPKRLSLAHEHDYKQQQDRKSFDDTRLDNTNNNDNNSSNSPTPIDTFRRPMSLDRNKQVPSRLTSLEPKSLQDGQTRLSICQYHIRPGDSLVSESSVSDTSNCCQTDSNSGKCGNVCRRMKVQ